MKIDPKVLQRVQRDLEEELLFGRPAEVLLDENNLVVEPNSYITPQQARDYFSIHVDLDFEDYIGPAILTLQQELAKKLLRSYGVINTGGA